MIKMKDGLASLTAALEHVGRAVRITRPGPAAARPPFTRCAGCGKAGRDDQKVPDPAQYTDKLGTSDGIVGNAAVVPARPAVDTDAPVDTFIHYGSGDPGAQAARISQEEVRRGGYAPDVKLIDAAPVRCSCGRWYHAIRCYSIHRHD
jgi:hypothetical protein